MDDKRTIYNHILYTKNRDLRIHYPQSLFLYTITHTHHSQLIFPTHTIFYSLEKEENSSTKPQKKLKHTHTISFTHTPILSHHTHIHYTIEDGGRENDGLSEQERNK